MPTTDPADAVLDIVRMQASAPCETATWLAAGRTGTPCETSHVDR
jgi:hypothetical protein